MNFTNISEIKDHLNSLKRIFSIENNVSYINIFSKIELNNFYLELYAGPRALCEPRVMYDNILHYAKIQVAIYEIIKELEHAISPSIDNRFAGFEWVKYFTYTNLKDKVKPSYMGEMIPMSDVILLIRDVFKISRLKAFM